MYENKECQVCMALVTLQKALEQYSSLIAQVEKMDIAEKLTREQKKQFDQILGELKDLPDEIQSSAKIISDLIIQSELSGKQLSDCNSIYMQIVKKVIAIFNLDSKITRLPQYWLIQICTVRQTVLLSVRVFFKWMFALGRKNLLYSKSELHSKVMDGQQFSDKEIWQIFFEGKARSPYFEQYAEKLFSYDIAVLQLPDSIFSYFSPGIDTLGDLCEIPFGTFQSISEDLRKLGCYTGMKLISEKLAELGLCFEITKEDLISVFSFPLVIRHLKGFDASYHARCMLGPVKIMYN